jgi:hypothetical protein
MKRLFNAARSRDSVFLPLSLRTIAFVVFEYRGPAQTQVSTIRSPQERTTASDIENPTAQNIAVWLNRPLSVFENKTRFTKAIVYPC